jgi:hypothetical protein
MGYVSRNRLDGKGNTFCVYTGFRIFSTTSIIQYTHLLITNKFDHLLSFHVSFKNSSSTIMATGFDIGTRTCKTDTNFLSYLPLTSYYFLPYLTILLVVIKDFKYFFFYL